VTAAAPIDQEAAVPAEVSIGDSGDGGEPALPERITLDEVRQLLRTHEPIVMLDVRTPRTYESDPFIARGALRVPPDDAVRLVTARGIPWKATLVAYCA
jgi:hypothetical protein